MSVVGLFTLGTVAVIGFLATRAASAAHHVFASGPVIGVLSSGTPLKTDDQGRTNILVFGSSQDDAGHGGMWLDDSIQVVSIDATTKRAAMTAIPRDVWVTLDPGCLVGSEAKINAVWECAAGVFDQSQSALPDYAARDARGAAALADAVQQVTGIATQYYVHVDYAALSRSVDAVGGIDVTITGDGGDGIYDTNLDTCTAPIPSCRTVYYPHNGIYHLDGEQALALSRARGDANPRAYLDVGLARGDFDREHNQQLVMAALLHKATSAGVLLNPAAIDDLLSALGDNLTTNLSTSEAGTLRALGSSLDQAGLQHVSLTDPQQPLLVPGEQGGQSVVVPTAGTFSYDAVHSFLAAALPAALGE